MAALSEESAPASAAAPSFSSEVERFLALSQTAQAEGREELDEAAKETFAIGLSGRAKMLIGLAVIAAAVASLVLGHFEMSPAQTFDALFSYPVKIFDYWAACFADPSLWTEGSVPMTDPERVVWRIRLPRIIVVMFVGAALAIAGASYQGMFKNPLTSPDLLGASAGASLGACLALLWNMSGEMVQLFAFAGGLIAGGATMWLNRLVGRYDPLLGQVLAGMLVGTLFQSGMSVIKLTADASDKLPQITFWLMGSFHDVNVGDLIVLLPMVVGFAVLLFQAWKLNVLSFGDEEARAMGINTGRTRIWVISAATLITSASVAVAGIVGWVGLVIPHLARAVVGPNYKVLLPTSLFIGAIFLLLVDDLARLLLAVEIPIGILTALLGVPFFVVIFKRNMRGW